MCYRKGYSQSKYYRFLRKLLRTCGLYKKASCGNQERNFKYEIIFCDFQNSGIKKCRRYDKNNKLAMRLDKETL